jgi:hypothetical protein
MRGPVTQVTIVSAMRPYLAGRDAGCVTVGAHASPCSLGVAETCGREHASEAADDGDGW